MQINLVGQVKDKMENNDFYEELLDKQSIDELLGEAQKPKVNKELEKILNRDKNGKPRIEISSRYNPVVNVLSQGDYDLLMQVFECGGIKRYGFKGPLFPTSINLWKHLKEQTCISFESYPRGTTFEYDDLECYRKKGLWPVTPIHFYSLQGVKSNIIKEINEWFDANKPSRASKG